uniref:G protein n=1 Tax=Hapavirus flanders TaxID=1972612 RepID=A0A385I4R1_9RHAB|nr:G protein [Hapavirus flanders]
MSYLIVKVVILFLVGIDKQVLSWTHDSGRSFVRQYHDPNWFDQTMVYPIGCNSTWQEVNTLNLRCPKSLKIDPKNKLNFDLGTVYHPLPSSRYVVNGYICHKQTWISKCEETWYFSTTETNKIENVPITPEDCREAVTIYEMGEYVNPFFPPFYCSWCSTQIDKKTFVIVEPHIVKEDIYNKTFIDPLFLNGYCDQLPCKTIHPDVLWVPQELQKRKDLCNKGTWETGKVFGVLEEKLYQNGYLKDNRFGIDEQWIRSSIYGLRSLVGSCYRGVCRQFGIRFKTGEWWGLEGKDVTGWIKQIIPRCQENQYVSFHHDNSDENIAEAQLVARELVCEEFLGRAKGGDLISPFDLNYLLPLNPGLGPSYRAFKRILKKDSHGGSSPQFRLEKRDCIYSVVHNVTEKVNITNNKLAIGQLFDGSYVYINESEFSRPGYLNNSDNASRDGWFLLSLNGMIKYGNSVYLPHGVSTGLSGIQDIVERGTLMLLDHPKSIAISNQMDLAKNIYTSYFQMNTTSIGSKIENMIIRAKNAVSSYFSQLTNIAWWIGTGILGLLGFIVIKRFHLIQLICGKKHRNGKIKKKNNKLNNDDQEAHVYDIISNTPKTPPHGKGTGVKYFDY